MYRLFFRLCIRPLPAEFAHHAGLAGIRWGGWAARLLRWTPFFPRPRAAGAVSALGLTFPGPLGLAAGMDKDATSVYGILSVGFAYVEVGTITPLAQPGNPKPRSWRELDVRGLRNQMGFNNEGADAAARRLARLRRTSWGSKAIVGVNIGKNKVTPPEKAADDYAACATTLAPYASYIAVNVSSPNTPGLRDLQAVESLRPILVATRDAADEAAGRHVPVLVKIAPDLSDADVDAVAALVLDIGLDGVIATNTTIAHDRGPGGLSGPPLLPRALEVVARLRAALGPDPVIMGGGGISSEEDARAMLAAGATLLQAYTAFVFQGPSWPARMNAVLTRSAK